MIYPIHIIGSKVLRKVAENIDKDYPNLSEIIENMKETMHDSEGVGLAAPQIGKSIRLFVVDASPFEEDDPELAKFKKVFINAKITERFGDKMVSNEGCLSIPGIREDVERFDKIKIQYVDEDFEKQEEVFEGMAAIIVQHEYDHLEGILFTDKISPIRRKMLKMKLVNISKGRFNAVYSYKLKA